MSEKFKGVKKFIFETSVIIIGISISFWLSNLQEKSNNKNKEIEILESIDININEIQKYIDNRRETLDEDNQLMDYLSTHWNNLNLDSIVEVLQFGRHKKAFHNVFLDYREFHPPVSEISSIIGDGSISLISNHDVKIQLISLMDNSYDFVNQNVKSEIELQQSFRAKLVQEESYEISKILETTQNEMRQRIRGEVDNRKKILAELKAITKLRSAKNYLNLKIRQRFWIMNFYNTFDENLNVLRELVVKELELIKN
ncbi:MAG: hypothetical protein O3C01_01410 [Bacteroidetes bacterium]|nr:hypothetical protein [Bacteroidota bacterium]MDA1019879.1 hypothetical protein [Bacteroidota bacterium]